MVLGAKWIVTNITKSPIKIIRATLVPPNQDTPALVLRPSGKSFGNFAVGVKATTEVITNFFVQPALAKAGEPFKAKVLMYDQFGNEHQAEVVFAPKVPQSSNTTR